MGHVVSMRGLILVMRSSQSEDNETVCQRGIQKISLTQVTSREMKKSSATLVYPHAAVFASIAIRLRTWTEFTLAL